MSNEEKNTEQQTATTEEPDESKKSAAIRLSQVNLNQPEATTVEVTGGLETTPEASPTRYSYGIAKYNFRFDPLSVGFAVLVLVGGIIGYITKGSLASVVSSVVFALLIGGSVYIEGVRRNPYPLIATLFVLYSLMLYRYSLSHSFMPSGFIAILTLIMLIRHEFLLYKRRELIKA